MEVTMEHYTELERAWGALECLERSSAPVDLEAIRGVLEAIEEWQRVRREYLAGLKEEPRLGASERRLLQL